MKVKLFSMFVLTILLSCQNDFVPKPKGYFRIDFPKKEYVLYQKQDCPYQFKYPVYAVAEPAENQTQNPCWVNLHFPNFDAKVYLTYKVVKNNLPKYLEDSHNLAYEHHVKASSITGTPLDLTHENVHGLIYEIKGDVASSLQFYVTDSTNHFLRGSLYFNVAPNIDSLDVVIDFLKVDIDSLLQSFEWTQPSNS